MHCMHVYVHCMHAYVHACTHNVVSHNSYIIKVSSMLTECKWDDSLLEVELWITAAQMALDNKNYELVSVHDDNEFPEV